jgi:hypothetical protein
MALAPARSGWTASQAWPALSQQSDCEQTRSPDSSGAAPQIVLRGAGIAYFGDAFARYTEVTVRLAAALRDSVQAAT